jgi:RNA-directed DNA polymerase
MTFYVAYHRRKIDALKGDTSPEAQVRRARHEQKVREFSAMQKRLPADDPLDPTYRRLFYARYADDFLIGIIGSKHEAETLFREIKTFLHTSLKLEISEEKSGIHHAKEGTAFLGYVVQNYTSEYKKKVRSPVYTRVGAAVRRNMRERIQLRIPERKLSEFCHRKGYGDYERLQPSRNPKWLRVDDEEILLGYNAEMRGIANYYALASGAKQGLNKLMYLAESSFLQTLANKHNTTASKIASRLRQGKDLVVTTSTKEGNPRRYKLFKLRDWKPLPHKGEVDAMPLTGIHLRFSRSSIQQRLEANVCEFCGKEKGFFEVHHVKKLKDVQGKEGWKQIMIARKRKTLILCNACHDKLHAGKLSYRPKKF